MISVSDMSTMDFIKEESLDYIVKEEHDVFFENPKELSHSSDYLNCYSTTESSLKKLSTFIYDNRVDSNTLHNAGADEPNFYEVKIKREPSTEEIHFFDHKDINNLSVNDESDLKNLDAIKQEQSSVSNFLNYNPYNNFNECRLYCDYCNFSSTYRGNLVRHIKLKHFGNKSLKRFKCTICKYRCCCPSDLRRHESKHSKKFVYYCYFCDYGINRKNRIFEHLYKHHPFTNGQFDQVTKCYSCGYSTKDKSSLLCHMLVDHKRKKTQAFSDKEEKPVIMYPCQLCSYVTTCRSTLLNHIDGFHKKIRPYSCQLCSYDASRRSDLRIHISATHEKLTPFKCHICNYTSAYKKHLRRHILSQHILKKMSKYKRCYQI